MNHSDRKRAQYAIYLIRRWKDNAITEEEGQELEAWLRQHPDNRRVYNALMDAEEQDKALRSMNAYPVEGSLKALKEMMRAEIRAKRSKKHYAWLSAAAALLMVMGAILFIMINQHRDGLPAPAYALQDVAPGYSRATLTLDDGSVLELAGGKQGLKLNASGWSYIDGTPIGRLSHPLDGAKGRYATLTTPKGGQYQVILPDGTHVWLNAASSLRYPNHFEGQQRIVELTGEAYFEVAHRKQAKSSRLMPFIVKTADQNVEVLGTHFNINSYADEVITATTLVEGSVRVSTAWGHAQVLSPNQQSIVTPGDPVIDVRSVNPEAAVNWKSGDFIWDGDVKKMMRQIARWYNVEVAYKGTIKAEEFGGRVSRSKGLREVLEVLESTSQIQFTLEETDTEGVSARVVVMP